jgi:hypothetical protein
MKGIKMNDIDYKNKKIRNIRIFIGLGVGLIILSGILNFFEIKIGIDDFWITMFNTFGLMLVVGSLSRYILIKRKPSWLRINKIAEHDERNVFLRGKAAYSAFIISLMGLTLIAVIFVYLEYIIPLYLVTSIIIIQYISFLVFTKYYGNKL